jgi:hypothetical protein
MRKNPKTFVLLSYFGAECAQSPHGRGPSPIEDKQGACLATAAPAAKPGGDLPRRLAQR